MTVGLRVVSILIGAFLFIFIIELVRRRKLGEEYAWLWLITGMVVVLLSVWYDLLVFVSGLIGGILPSSVLFFFGMIFLLLISIHHSVKISRLSDQVKTLTQEIALKSISRKGLEEKP